MGLFFFFLGGGAPWLTCRFYSALIALCQCLLLGCFFDQIIEASHRKLDLIYMLFALLSLRISVIGNNTLLEVLLMENKDEIRTFSC